MAKKRLDESYTNWGTGDEPGMGAAGGEGLPSGRFGKWLSKFFAQRGRPAKFPDFNLRGDTYGTEDIIRADNIGGPSVLKGIISLPEVERARKKRYSEYEDMDNYPEVNASLDIYADDSTQRDLNDKVICVKTEDPYLREQIEKLFDRIELNKYIWDITRNVAKYGDCFIEPIWNIKYPRQGLVKLKILNPNYMYRVENEFGYLKNFLQEIPHELQIRGGGNAEKFIELEKHQIIHLRVHTSDPMFYPYGKGILAAATRIYRSLKLMEDAMLIYRLTRAPERRVFYIDVGNMPASKAQAFIEKQKQKFKKEKFFNPGTKDIDERYNPLSADEDFFIPTRKDSKASRVEVLAGAQNLGDVDDVKYFRDKLMAALKIPKDYVVDKDKSPERKANLSQLDVKFARAVIRLQNEIEIGLTSMVKYHLKLREFPLALINNFSIQLAPPSDMHEKRKLELADAKIRVVQAYKAIGMFSNEYIYTHFFNFTPEEIEALEKAVEEDMTKEAELQKKINPEPMVPPEMMGGMMPPGEETVGPSGETESSEDFGGEGEQPINKQNNPPPK